MTFFCNFISFMRSEKIVQQMNHCIIISLYCCFVKITNGLGLDTKTLNWVYKSMICGAEWPM